MRKPELNMTEARESLLSALDAYKRVYMDAKRRGEDEIMQGALNLANGAKTRLLELELGVK